MDDLTTLTVDADWGVGLDGCEPANTNTRSRHMALKATPKRIRGRICVCCGGGGEVKDMSGI